MRNEHFQSLNLKRKYYGKGKKNFKKFKKYLPKKVRDNPENRKAWEEEKKNRDVYEFTDSDSDDQRADDLGMGIELSDLPFLCNDDPTNKPNQLFSLTQDTVGPMFSTEENYDPIRVNDALVELKHKSFRPFQEDAIKRVLMGKSTLFISQTGSGKSLCYQLPALLYWRFKKYITIVVSPLISLMDDQIKNFPKELVAVSLNSGSTKAQRQKSIDMLINGEAQVAFMSPEAIVNGVLSMDDLRNLPPVGFVCIDEAHCLCEWSQNFRPAYLQFFNILQKQINIKTYLGLTATATRPTSIAIANHLNITIPEGIIGATKIPENLILSVSRHSNKDLAIINLLKSDTFKILPSIIIYCSRREDTERVASTIRASMQRYSSIVLAPEKETLLEDQNLEESEVIQIDDKDLLRLTWDAEAYHAGLSMEKRKQIQKRFIKGGLRVVVATIAFGMGINKSNVKAIIHYDMPGSFENYIQEIGRAGRDGKPAQCHMMLSIDQTDMYWQQRSIYGNVVEYHKLKKLVDFMFPKCQCESNAPDDLVLERKKQNEEDPAILIESNQSKNQNEEETGNDENSELRKSKHSLIRKYRFCTGHEIAFSIEEATEALNISSESIITLICKLQEAYPQLKIEINNPIQSNLKVYCHNGPEQLQTLISTIKPPRLRAACISERRRILPQDQYSSVNKITFDLVALANKSGLTSSDVRRHFKQTEWLLDDKTGRYKRSQVRTSLSGLSFHLKLLTDINNHERDEINQYLKNYTTNYIQQERLKIGNVYKVFRQHALELEQMNDKICRLKTSLSLKSTLHRYFEAEDGSKEIKSSPIKTGFKMDHMNNVIINNKIDEGLVRRRIKSFISAHGTQHSSRSIARILQGISTPNYPADIWGTNRNWWRSILNIDFEHLNHICEEELFLVNRKPTVVKIKEEPNK